MVLQEWVPRDGRQYALTIIAVIILGMFYKLLKEGRSIYEGYANHKQKEDAVNYVGFVHAYHLQRQAHFDTIALTGCSSSEHHSVNHDSGLGETDLTNGHGRLHHGHSSGGNPNGLHPASQVTHFPSLSLCSPLLSSSPWGLCQ